MFKPSSVHRTECLHGPWDAVATYRVEARLEGGGRRVLHLIEKNFAFDPALVRHQNMGMGGPDRLAEAERILRLQQEEHAQHYSVVSQVLRRAGINTVSVRLMRNEDGSHRIFLGDLSEGGQHNVIEWADVSENETEEARSLPNYSEVKALIESQTADAASAGARIFSLRAWLILIDGRTGRGRPFVADFKHVFLPRLPD